MRGCFMKKNVTKLATSMLAACFLTVGAIPALAGTWQKSGNNWTYLNDAGQMVAGQMVNDNNHLYYLGTDGIMKTGLVPLNGAYLTMVPGITCKVQQSILDRWQSTQHRSSMERPITLVQMARWLLILPLAVLSMELMELR